MILAVITIFAFREEEIGILYHKRGQAQLTMEYPFLHWKVTSCYVNNYFCNTHYDTPKTWPIVKEYYKNNIYNNLVEIVSYLAQSVLSSLTNFFIFISSMRALGQQVAIGPYGPRGY